MSGARSRRGAVAHAGGLVAEAAACTALIDDGWEILRRRARTAAGEIDVVARRGSMVAFIEVKARATLADGAHAVAEPQRRRLLRAAAALLAEHPEWTTGDLRFDVVVVDAAGRVRRIVDAIRAHDTESDDPR